MQAAVRRGASLFAAILCAAIAMLAGLKLPAAFANHPGPTPTLHAVSGLVGFDGTGDLVVCYTATGSSTPAWTTGDTRSIVHISSVVCSKPVRLYADPNWLP